LKKLIRKKTEAIMKYYYKETGIEEILENARENRILHKEKFQGTALDL
jgi:hypothetical protein